MKVSEYPRFKIPLDALFCMYACILFAIDDIFWILRIFNGLYINRITTRQKKTLKDRLKSHKIVLKWFALYKLNLVIKI